MPTMCLLLRNLAEINIATTLPHAADNTFGSDLARIEYYRKEFVHSQHEISDNDFRLIWDTITKAISRLSNVDLKAEFESLLTGSLTGANEKVVEFNLVRRPCDVCDFKNIKEASVVWCLNCDESLCQHCLDHHSVHKLSRYHEVINIEEYLKDPSKTTITCSEHKQEFDFFCEGHRTPLCVLCVMNDHKSCQLIKPIQIAITQSDHTKHELNERVNKLLQNIDGIIVDVQSNLKSYEIEKGKVRGQLRSKLKLAAEDVESLCLKDIAQHENSTNVLFRNLSKHQKETKRLLNNLSKLNEKNIRSLMTMLEIDNKIKDQEVNIQFLLKDRVINTFHIATDVDLLAMKTIICSIHEISLSSALNKLDETGAQQKKKTGIVKIADFKVEKRTNDNDIRGCSIINDNVVCFADRGNNRLIFMTLQGYQKEIKLTCEPVDIATVDHAKVAVSMYDNTIKIINIESWKWEDFSFSDENTIGGLAFYENQIFSRVGGIGYLIIDLSGKVQQTVTIEGSNMPYVSVSQDKLYSARWDTGEIFCFDLQGKTNWKLEYKSLVNPPNGITTDSEGNAYVTGSFSNNVIFISSDGKETKEIISSSENLKNPIAIDYDKKTDRLLVSVASGLGCLFLMKNK
ncbi:tripartite motif-containing protein 2/3 [Mytilus galloprovincialis]|uniref:Tripartite motif-containing protein 2/3 n=1 Tax=Mytilus galloprovincialis TaxID=29158 RepID=A0A8B6CUL8_MYTGA|nr:tripartite motif-containing protein 2/3 [Mytilus galloprovincialis]